MKATNPKSFTATHKHIGANQYARKQATKPQLKDARVFLHANGYLEEAALCQAELELRK
jgi:hypothetical protein